MAHSETRSESMRRRWADPEFKARMCAMRKGTRTGAENPSYGNHKSPATRKKLSIALKGRPKSEEHKKKIGAAQKGKRRPYQEGDKNVMKRPEIQAKHIEAIHRPEVRAKISAAGIGRHPSEETIQKMRKAMKGRLFSADHLKHVIESNKSPEVRAKVSASKTLDKNPNWKGGISFTPYCPKFTDKLKESVRDSFDHRCYLCGAPENEKRHAVHHVDYNKGQGCGQRWTLVPLCWSCHAKTNSKRWYWFARLSNYWLDKYIQSNMEIYL